MQLAFLNLPPAERELYFQQAAAQRGVNAVIMEKDFWVCWLLGLLFGDVGVKDNLVFKGGTSLSKVFGIIQRFSEDIDLSLTPQFVGIAEEEVEQATSRTQRDKWMDRLEEACGLAVQERVQLTLERGVRDVLGPRPNGETWLQFHIDEESRSPVLLFHYPTIQTQGFAYLQPLVKMEFGSLTDQRPVGSHPIRPWVAEQIPDSFPDWRCDVVALDVERTYWEKATILHAEYHRPDDKPTPIRYSRHYADMAALAVHHDSRNAVLRADLREKVVLWKSRFFASTGARYDLAYPGTFRLVPPAHRIPDLNADYAAMRPMYMTEPLSFEDVLRALDDLESRINEGAR